MDLLERVLWIVTTPLWVPTMILEDIERRAGTEPLVRGRVEDAWERCGAAWRECGRVCQFTSYDGSAFQHDLAVAMAPKHRRHRGFFLGKVADPDPLLAAYAFKCLIRVGSLRREDLPAEAL